MLNHDRYVRTRERTASVLVWFLAAAVIGVLAWILSDVFRWGWSVVSISFLMDSPLDAGRGGGIAPMIVSTLMILAIAMSIAVPLSMTTAIALVTHTRRDAWFARVVRGSLDALAAVPSIVFGLFGNAVFCQALEMGYSIFAGGLTLACMILPIVIVTTEQSLRAVPNDLRWGAAALGLSRATTLMRIEFPIAAPAIAAGMMLGIGRALAETAALLFTAGYVSRMPESIWDSGRALSVHIYDMAMNVPAGNQHAAGTALVLVALLMLINAVTIRLSRISSRHVHVDRVMGERLN